MTREALARSAAALGVRVPDDAWPGVAAAVAMLARQASLVEACLHADADEETSKTP